VGSRAKRQAVQDFIDTGELDLEQPEDANDAVPDGPLDAQWLADIRGQRGRLAADPVTELPFYRELFGDIDLTLDQVDDVLAAMQHAIASPEVFYDELEAELVNEGVLDSIKTGASIAIDVVRWFPTRSPSHDERAAVARLAHDFALAELDINPRDHHFELSDPRWWPLIKADKHDMKRWPVGLAPFISHDATDSFVYPGKPAATHVAMMADFGCGLYHARAIAKQLEAKQYPYVFHLGDVYYGGSQAEFDANYTSVLDGTMKHSLLFSLPENHELYGGGIAYHKFLRDNRAAGRTVQAGSYFCVRFARHQIIGIDVNWNGRQRFVHDGSRAWLEDVIEQGDGLTTILVTGSAPYIYGQNATTRLYDDLEHWHAKGRFAMWLWGDDHYCAVFERDEIKANFCGSCVGHGGFPGTRQELGRDSFVPPVWVETEPRFPRRYGLRDDVGNNGWVELALLPSGGIALLYVDWLGCHRSRARYERDASGGLALAEFHSFEHRERSLP
jgi:hypothetical protein